MTTNKRQAGKEAALRTAVLLLKIALWGLPVQLAAVAVWKYADFRARPLAYAAQSAPWYTGVLLYAAVTAVLAIPCAALLILLKRKMKRTRRTPGDGKGERA